ncbi:MAG: hypothetical protein A3K19_10515 [Lentisphaerae bacterium RIFOXYB12_FULL_65_16]|nr:MAG: hypothetical protein A3K18_33020 [Lentisphaerae bacterium RIFOXYA12_64_32]OGV87942.1 MAG: hypothetical protein A3K19_10515 [Lentisphaerae bacterium RIFOXYB12_FULL_65_16]
MNFCFTVDDVCFEGYSTEAHLKHLLEFLGDAGVRATFFAVPLAQGVPLTQRLGYIRVLEQAIADGHEVAQHGLEHDRFEVGIPPEMILALPHEGPARERLAKDREAIEAALQVDKIRGRLAQGRRIMEDALGAKVVGFRAPCLQVCDNLFLALDAEGYRYDSSRHLQPAGWDILNGKESVAPEPITREMFRRLQPPGNLRAIPLTTEYTWYLNRERFALTLNLAKHDAQACITAGIPFVPICHVSPIQAGDPDAGFQFYRELFAFVRDRCADRDEPLSFVTLADACQTLS